MLPSTSRAVSPSSANSSYPCSDIRTSPARNKSRTRSMKSLKPYSPFQPLSFLGITLRFSGARLFARPTASALFGPVIRAWSSSRASAVIFHSNVCTSFHCCTDKARCVQFRGTSHRVRAVPSFVNPAEAYWETSHGAAQSLAR